MFPWTSHSSSKHPSARPTGPTLHTAAVRQFHGILSPSKQMSRVPTACQALQRVLELEKQADVATRHSCAHYSREAYGGTDLAVEVRDTPEMQWQGRQSPHLDRCCFRSRLPLTPAAGLRSIHFTSVFPPVKRGQAAHQSQWVVVRMQRARREALAEHGSWPGHAGRDEHRHGHYCCSCVIS